MSIDAFLVSRSVENNTTFLPRFFSFGVTKNVHSNIV